MRTQTIWESASRPLFVRSVWLQGASNFEGYRRHQRHFILDYEPQHYVGKKYSQSNRIPLRRQKNYRKETLQHATSYDSSETSGATQSTTTPTNLDDIILIDSGRVKLHKQTSQQHQQQQQSSSQQQNFSRQRSSCPVKKQSSLEGVCQSRQNSIQDAAASTPNQSIAPDECLAERVLQWLDLAGKTDMIERRNSVDETAGDAIRKRFMKPRLSNASSTTTAILQKQQPRSKTAPHAKRSGITRKLYNRARQNSKRNTNFERRRQEHPTANAPHRPHVDAVKHITIIFNKEGIPVRFNRPARNIDLCSLTCSAGTTRRLAGTLASTRLYSNSTESYMLSHGPVANNAQIKGDQEEPRNKLKKFQSKSYTDGFDGNIQSSRSSNDLKQQLHIFMPNLPKKGLANAMDTEYSTITSIDDSAVSLLSNTFSENCKM